MCHFSTPAGNCYNADNLILIFVLSDMSRIEKTLYPLTVTHAVPSRSQKETIAFNLISVRTTVWDWNLEELSLSLSLCLYVCVWCKIFFEKSIVILLNAVVIVYDVLFHKNM